MRIIVTGACGFIGKNLVKHLKSVGHDVLPVDQSHHSTRQLKADQKPEAPPFPYRSQRCEILDIEDLEMADAVVHLAANGSVSASMSDPLSFRENGDVTLQMLEKCRRAGVKRFIYASTAGAAFGRLSGIVDERSLPCPSSMYGASKLAGEVFCSAYDDLGVHTVALRFGNVYGPESWHKRNAIPNFMKAIAKDEVVTINGSGNQLRSFVFVDDVVDAICMALETKHHGPFHIVGDHIHSINDVLKIMRSFISTGDLATLNKPRPSGEVRDDLMVLNLTARANLGWSPKINMADGLRMTWDWFRERV